MRTRFRIGFLCLAASLVTAQAFAQSAAPADDAALKAKREQLGGAMAVSYGMDHCDVPTTAKQRADVQGKIATLKQQTGMTGDLTPDMMKDMIGLKTDQDVKDFCTGLGVLLPGMISGLLADKPPAEWSKPAAAAAPASPPAPGKTTVGDWEIEPVDGAPGQCTITRDYYDKGDDNAENAIILRGMSDQLLLVLSYAKWNWNAGEKTTAALVTSNDIINADAQWTADKTGKVISTSLSLNKATQLGQTEELIVKFPDGDASFEVPKLKDALAAMDACGKGH